MNNRLTTVILLLASMLFAGCATQSSGVANEERALQTYVQLGLSYLGNGQREQARFNLLKAMELDSNSPQALHAMALLYQSEGELELADQHFRRALAQDRDFSQARMNYARFLFLENEYSRARDEYRRVTQDTNYRLRADAFVGLALSELQLGNRTAGREALERALTLNPSQPSALLEAADLAWTQEDFQASRAYLDRYEVVARQTARSLWLGVRLARQANDTDRAASYGLALLEIYPDSREANQYRLSRTP